MTPSENIYRSEYDVVDGLIDEREMMEDDQYELIAEDEFDMDDGQPTIYDEYQDLYGGDDWDFGQYDYMEGEF